ncbi:unnamed protein product [Spirodela intermedia]|uniref:C3H1-type domain-containing protein n=1 Tax=Spirodela intermedia TaxID=51605 RepID=A0A7I8K2F8_SPIIN|nr:unnamed protein product [Spirodela intermedia]
MEDPSRTAGEEAVKKNTDCIYFLASPLTCKKGNECEFRHREGARVNPRDCWYWLNGNCLNPKCLFRHPPLEGLVGSPMSTLSGSTPSQMPVPDQVPVVHSVAANTSSKQRTPCYYFQKGSCLKGDRCLFFHGLQPIDNPNLPQPTGKVVSSPAVEAPNPLKPMQSKPRASAEKAAEGPRPQGKADIKAEASSRSGLLQRFPHGNGAWRPSNAPTRAHQPKPLNGSVQKSREADEPLRESSPGFDVLVDGGGASGHEGKEAIGGEDLDYLPSTGHNSRPRSEGERSNRDDEKGLKREGGSGEIDGSDLRHRLLKKRKGYGLRSSISTDRHGDARREDDEERHRSRRSGGDDKGFPRGSSISSRLRGRISLPGRSSSEKPRNMDSERDEDRGRSWGRSSSPGQRLDRMTQRNQEEDSAKKRALEGQPRRRDGADSLNFSAPRSLTDLRGAKFSDGSIRFDGSAVAQERKGARLNRALALNESEGSPSFEGPKPLSEILKRKREVARGSDAASSHGDEVNFKVREDPPGRPMVTKAAEAPGPTLEEARENPIITDGEELPQEDRSSPKMEATDREDGMKEDGEIDPEMEDYGQRNGEFEYDEGSEELPQPDQSSPREEMPEAEDGVLVDDMEDAEQRAGEEFGYDAAGAADYRSEDDDDDDEADDEDGDDFARKIGIMFT